MPLQKVILVLHSTLVSLCSWTAEFSRDVPDWQSNNAMVLDTEGKVIQSTIYYPYGEPTLEPHGQRYLFGGKEREHAGGRNSYDFSARNLTPYGIWSTQDPLAEKYYSYSPYSYCAGDPVNRVDRDGKEWYLAHYLSYNPDDETFKLNTRISYTDAKCIEDVILKRDEFDIKYLGNVAVVFEGSNEEKLSESGTIDGEGAINAAVTVYGKNGADDIDYYTGFTMSSDFEKYGAIADGIYNVIYAPIGKSGKLKSNYAINGRGYVPCVNGINPNPGADSKTHKNGVFIHSTSLYGRASGHTSTGCLLILDSQWERYKKQVGHTNHSLILNRNKNARIK